MNVHQRGDNIIGVWSTELVKIHLGWSWKTL